MHKYIRTKYQKFMQSFAKYNLSGSDTYSINGKGNEEMPRRFVGKDLKRIRKKYNLSQLCFAEMLGISVRSLQNYEIDHRAMPSTAVSLFVFADENKDLFRKHYLNKVKNLIPYRG